MTLAVVASGVVLASNATAADLMAPMAPPAMAAIPAAATDWSGAYVGANAGYSWGTGSGPNHPDISADGLIVGGQVGYNFQLDGGIVLGVQGDMDWSNASGSDALGTRADVNWTGAVTGHVGYAWDAFMPYVLGGVALANVKGTVVVAPAGSATKTFTGWTVGAGAETMLADNLSVFAEYRYADYGSQDVTIGGITSRESFKDNSVRAGINFHF